MGNTYLPIFENNAEIIFYYCIIGCRDSKHCRRENQLCAVERLRVVRGSRVRVVHHPPYLRWVCKQAVWRGRGVQKLPSWGEPVRQEVVSSSVRPCRGGRRRDGPDGRVVRARDEEERVQAGRNL